MGGRGAKRIFSATILPPLIPANHQPHCPALSLSLCIPTFWWRFSQSIKEILHTPSVKVSSTFGWEGGKCVRFPFRHSSVCLIRPGEHMGFHPISFIHPALAMGGPQTSTRSSTHCNRNYLTKQGGRSWRGTESNEFPSTLGGVLPEPSEMEIIYKFHLHS